MSKAPEYLCDGCGVVHQYGKHLTPSDSSHNTDAPKKYELHIADLLTIPEDRFDDFLVDLKKWHGACRATINMLNTIAGAVGEDKVAAKLTRMVWIDDGKHDGKVIITAPDTNEGGGDASNL